MTHTAATIWSRSDRAARMIVELSSHESFKKTRRIVGPDTFEHSDFTAKLRLNGLKPGEPTFYRIRFQDLNDLSKMSRTVVGRFKTPSLNLVIFVSRGPEIPQGKDTASTSIAAG